MTILALTSLEDCTHVCGVRTQEESSERPDQCIAIAGAVGDTSDLTVMTYCIPSLPSAGVRRVEEWAIAGTNSILNSIESVRFSDVVRGESLIVIHSTQVQQGAESDGGSTSSIMMMNNRIDIFNRGDVFLSQSSSWSQQLASEEYILELVQSAYPSFSNTVLKRIQGLLVQPQSDIQKIQGTAMIYMDIVSTVEETVISEGEEHQQFSSKRFNVCGEVHLSSKSFGSNVYASCDPALWDETDRGHAIFVGQDVLALIPAGISSMVSAMASDGQVHFVKVFASTPTTRLLDGAYRYSRPFKASDWFLSSGIPAAASSSSSAGFSVGFSTSTGVLVRRIPQVSQVGRVTEYARGDVDIYDDGVDTNVNMLVPVKVAIFSSNSPSSPTHWLSQIRLDIPLEGETTASSYMSQEVSSQITVKQKCNYQTCNGCLDLNVQRLCYGAQQCTLARCIGTLTNQNRPLCGIGKTAEALFTTQIAMIHGAYMVVVETVSTIIGFSLQKYEKDDKIVIMRWMDDAFFSYMCSAKDAIASFVSILTSVINFVVQSVSQKPVTYLEMGAQRVDSNFQAMFTLIITSFNNLLSQMLLGMLYPYFALQKTTICQLNTLMAFVDMTGYKVTIGMPEVQVSQCFDNVYSKSLFKFSGVHVLDSKASSALDSKASSTPSQSLTTMSATYSK